MNNMSKKQLSEENIRKLRLLDVREGLEQWRDILKDVVGIIKTIKQDATSSFRIYLPKSDFSEGDEILIVNLTRIGNVRI